MGNCQAVDTASLVIQHPAGKSEKLFWPIPASQVMKSNPGHYVALLITTTTTTTTDVPGADRSTVRITRVKLLRPTDTLTFGHVYRLISTEEVMKGLVAKKQAKLMKMKLQADVIPDKSIEKVLKQEVKPKSDLAVAGAGGASRPASAQAEKSKQMSKHERPLAAASRSKAWQPSLKSISEQSPNKAK